MSRLLLVPCLLGALALAAGCTGAARVATTAELEARVAAHPSDADALRDLGMALALRGDYGRARSALDRAATLRPTDGRSLYLLGLSTEALGPPEAAEPVYARYAQVPERDTYRDSLRGRHDAIVRRRLRVEFAGALAADTLGPATDVSAVGVLPFAYRGADPQYASLGRGLAEVLSVDLAAIGGLTVVERVRLEALLAEYELARRGQTDPTTVPRAGGLLRADRLVGGEVDVRDTALRLDAAVWAATPDSLAAETAEGTLAQLFAMQGALTERVLVALGVPVTAAQRTRLGTPPTDDLQAFLLFCRGLLEEDGGSYVRAAGLYQQAVARDPSFRLAAQRRAEALLAAAAAKPAPGVLSAAARGRPLDGMDLVGLRADALGTQLRPLFAPRPDTREPVVEGSQVGILGALPDPPPPPGSTP